MSPEWVTVYSQSLLPSPAPGNHGSLLSVFIDWLLPEILCMYDWAYITKHSVFKVQTCWSTLSVVSFFLSYGYATFCLSIQQLRDIEIVSWFCLFSMVMLRIFMYMSLCRSMFSFSWGNDMIPKSGNTGLYVNFIFNV